MSILSTDFSGSNIWPPILNFRHDPYFSWGVGEGVEHWACLRYLNYFSHTLFCWSQVSERIFPVLFLTLFMHLLIKAERSFDSADYYLFSIMLFLLLWWCILSGFSIMSIIDVSVHYESCCILLYVHANSFSFSCSSCFKVVFCFFVICFSNFLAVGY